MADNQTDDFGSSVLASFPVTLHHPTVFTFSLILIDIGWTHLHPILKLSPIQNILNYPT